MDPAAGDPVPDDYRERLLPGVGACSVVIAMIAMISIAYGAAFGATLGWALGCGLVLVSAVLAYRSAPLIEVSAVGLRAGGATLPWEFVGQAQSLDRDAMRLARGSAGDARTYLVLRGWAAPGGIRVQVEDPADPHPAWLLSSRHPDTLAGAIKAWHRAG